jgi:hypothetical protein
MNGPLLKGAFLEFMDTFLVPLPNVVVFQFNPETMTHSWTQAEDAPPPEKGKPNPLAVRGVPGETFQFELVLDAGDMIADGGPVGSALGEASGVYSRLAAIEMLQYPVSAKPDLEGTAQAAAAAAASGSVATADRPVPQSQVPTVLFVWGPGRILPIRVKELSVTEKLYDSFLNPTQASANITVSVLTPDDLAHLSGPLARIARGAYTYSQGLRKSLALANLSDPAQSLIGMIPF